MKILLVDNTRNRDSWGSSDLCEALQASQACTISVRRAPHEDLPPLRELSRFDRLVLSGSRTSATDSEPWVLRLQELISRSIESGLPILGVCYGHQILARVLGSILEGSPSQPWVRRSTTPEFGWTEIHRTPCPGGVDLMDGLPGRFYSFSAHYDEVIALPAAAETLAFSRGCRIQGYRLRDKPVFGIQFHPERTAEAGERSIREAKRADPKLTALHPGKGRKLHSRQVAHTIFGNFLRHGGR